MSGPARPRATAFWPTVRLLLDAARRRARGRAARQSELLAQGRGSGDPLGCAAVFVALALAAWVHGAFATALGDAAREVQALRATAAGKLVVAGETVRALARIERPAPGPEAAPLPPDAEKAARSAVHWEALVHSRPGDRSDREERLLDHYRRAGADGFEAAADLAALGRAGAPLDPLVGLVGSLLVLAWFLMLAFQGEGLELDLQRRRHPMWEWLLAHPVDPRAVFLAEMLSPLASNPAVWLSPIFWIGAFWSVYGSFWIGLVAGLLAGPPLAVAAACLAKAMEVVVVLRVAPRQRGAVLGLLSWLGTAIFFAALVLARSSSLMGALVRGLAPLAGGGGAAPLAWLLGLRAGPSPWAGVLACWLAAAAVIALSAQVAALATRRGLAGAFGGAPPAPATLAAGPARTTRGDPVHRKELLWLWRDRGALVQVFLVPLSVAAFQLFNLRLLASDLAGSWHAMAGATVIFGTYFVATLGPRSLVSEGPALWLALTWPRGLEALLKAKARLWWLAATALLAPLLVLTAVRFPADAWKVAAVGALWLVFGRSLADKSVTLVVAPSSAGEPEPLPRGRHTATMIGAFSFAVGVLTQQWQLAALGVIYSWLSAAALWQAFRARLPFLFDPWSEREPAPPTLAHAMLAVGGMLELFSVILGGALLFAGPDAIMGARAFAYGLSAFLVVLFVNGWLAQRGRDPRVVWRWDGVPARLATLVPGAILGVSLGLVLGAAGAAYASLLSQHESWGAPLREASRVLAADPASRRWYGFMAIALAPLAEEYLFRGLLYRALDREWGGAKAVLGSALLFTVYHPPLAWPLVFLGGVAMALVFKRTGHLLPAVLLHVTYNTFIVLTT